MTGAARDRLALLRHELRTPLNAVLGYSEMLLEDCAELEGETGTAEPVAALGQINAAGVELLSLVNAALDPATGVDVETPAGRASLASRLEPQLRPLIDTGFARCTTLLSQVAESPAAWLIPDLRKIQEAAERFSYLVAHVGDAQTSREAPARRPGSAAMPTPPDGLDPVLIVDDKEVNRDVLTRQLRRQGLATAVAEDGEQALRMLQGADFDLVLLDLMMPGMTGDAVLRQIKADPRLRDIPVIMISALDEIDTVVACIELGAEDYLPKPFDPVLLRARVGACLEQKRLRDVELDYLHNVDRLTAAAAAVESGKFDPEALAGVAERDDELGRLARVFAHMADEVRAREQRLRSQVRQLRIEINQSRTARQVAEITETDYFRDLLRKVDTLRVRADDEQ
jgi:CheY-like chemotaxis protein